MRQFIGLYSAGMALTGLENVFVKKLASSAGGINDDAYRMKPLQIMEGIEPGLYIGIVTFNSIVDVKIIPMKLSNQALLESILDEELRAECIKTFDTIFGADEPT